MPDYAITSSTDAAQADVDAVIEGLIAFNDAHAGSMNRRRVHLIARDEHGVVRGGLLGRQLWGWLYVEILWVDEEARGRGLGTRLLTQAEQEAREAGCTRVLLDTFEFQAPAFYQRMGYSVFGVLEDFPPGYRRYYLRKELT
jgi:GNAT superfamily N-acetyltransferase